MTNHNHTTNNKVAVDRLVLDRVRQQASTRWGAVTPPEGRSPENSRRSTRRIPPTGAASGSRSLRDARTTAFATSGSVRGSRSLRETRTSAVVDHSRSRSGEDHNRSCRSSRRLAARTTGNIRSKSSSQLVPLTDNSGNHGSPSGISGSGRRVVRHRDHHHHHGRSSPPASMSRSCSSIQTNSTSSPSTRRRGGRRPTANINHTSALKGLQAIIAISQNSPRKVPTSPTITTTSTSTDGSAAAAAKMRKASLLLHSLGHSTNKLHLSSPQLMREEQQQDIKDRNRSIVQGFLQKEPSIRQKRQRHPVSRIANHAA